MTEKLDVYELLEQKLLPYEKIAGIPIERVDEALVAIEQTDLLLTEQIEPAMFAITGEEIYVRETVANMLGKASVALVKADDTMQLKVVYGYRHPSIQTSYFDELQLQLAAEKPELTGKELFNEALKFIAAPEIAGHPTGASVDLQVLKDGEPLDMGTKNMEFVSDTFVFSPFISSEAWHNRQLIRQVMLSCGFAPYDGEWWHFSYGDREWAAYYNQPTAIYGPIEFDISMAKN